MRHTVIGVLAHVDAGKTTLTESMLYECGQIRKLGRVDHQNVFLDYHQQERNRGITIFSKQAVLQYQDLTMQLLDTPGHVDFSAEMERTLQVLDYAIIIISALDGVQVHTETIWKLLKHYQIPTFIFVNKMDITHYPKDVLMSELKQKLSENCIDFGLAKKELEEQAAMCDDTLLDTYLLKQSLEAVHYQEAIAKRMMFPVYFGSALKLEGVKGLLNGLSAYIKEKTYPEQFGAKVYKVTHEEGTTFTHVKVTGGTLTAKQVLENGEKIDQLRRYHGVQFQLLQAANAGEIVTLKGIRHLHAGEGLGYEKNEQPVLTAYLNYEVIPPKNCDVFVLRKQLEELSKEDPQLHVDCNRKGNIQVRFMGEIQIEVFKQMVMDRYHVEIELDQGSVSYLETVASTVEGVGHFEPLRHYAEVHLLVEPLPSGSGIEVVSACPKETLAMNWQHQIINCLEESKAVGVLSGSEVSDIRITLLGGKAHLKHTEGGDFREATMRALRNALKKAECVLLEPYYAYRMTLPSNMISRAIYDIEMMNGSFEIIQDDGMVCILGGEAPVSQMRNYQLTLHSYTKGQGTLQCHLKAFLPCNRQSEIIHEIGYDSEQDIQYPTGSIFCAHGAGFYVKWDEVEQYMHLPYYYQPKKEKEVIQQPVMKRTYGEEELSAIFNRTYRSSKAKEMKKLLKRTEKSEQVPMKKAKKRCTLVDGYNVIFADEYLSALAKDQIDMARTTLISMLGNYQGYMGGLLILVFDAYQMNHAAETIVQDGSIYVVYTKEAQTADMYIEQVTHQMASEYEIRVVTSDATIQYIVIGQGASRISSREFLEEVAFTNTEKLNEYQTQTQYHFDQPLAKIRKWNEE